MPSMPRARLRTFLVAAVAGGLLAGPVAVAGATGDKEDHRAVIVPGNVTTCAEVGLDGVELKGDIDFDYELSDQQKYLTITALTEGVTVTGIIVKGGPDTNIYVPGERGLPEEPVLRKLRSPLNGGGQIPTISHWLVCGEVSPPSNTEPTPVPEPSETTTSTPPQPTSTTTAPTESATGESSTTPVTTTSREAGAVVATTTTEAPVAPAGESGDLASTGFGGGWLLVAGVGLLAGGGALVLLARARRGQA